MVYVKITSDVSNDGIFYTLDGSDPTRDSNRYLEPFALYSSCTIKAIVVKDEWVDSDVSVLEVEVPASTPVIRKIGGDTPDYCWIEVTNTEDYGKTEGVRFYYTYDGTEPTKESESFALGTMLKVEQNGKLKIKGGGLVNEMSPGTVDITVNNLRCQVPTVSTFYEKETKRVNVTLNCKTSDVEMFYTIDGSAPTKASYPYAGPFYLERNCTLKAVAMKTNLIMSDLVSKVINVTLPNPVLSYDSTRKIVSILNLGSFDLSITAFYYTLDGSVPSSKATPYNQITGISVEEGQRVRLIAIGAEGVSSKVVDLIVPETMYKVSFETNGGTEFVPQTVRKGEKAVNPGVPEKEGFTFLHWYVTDPEVPYDFDTEVTSDLILIAAYSAIPVHTVSFNSDGGTEFPAQDVREGSKVTNPGAPKKTGFKFIHWYRNDQQTAYDFDAAVTESFVLTALYEAEIPEDTAEVGKAVVGKARVI